MKPTRKKVLGILLAVYAVLIVVCFLFSRSLLYSDTPRVTVGAFSYGNLHKRYTLQGSYQAEFSTPVVIDPERQYEAIVTEVCATPGSSVGEGDVLYKCRVSPALQEDLHKAKQALDTARLELLEAQWDDSLYAAYVRYIAAEDACLAEAEDPQLQESVAQAQAELLSLADTKQKQAQLDTLRRTYSTLSAREDEYLTLTRLCDALETVRAPSAGFLISLPLYPDDVLRTDRACAVLSQSDLLIAQFPLTQEQAAFYLSNEGVVSSQVRIGNATISASVPTLISTGEKPCLQLATPYSSALYHANVTLEIDLLTAEGMLLPRTAVHRIDGRQASFFAIDYREGFFGREAFVVEEQASLLDWDDEYVMLKTERAVGSAVVVESTQDLSDRCTVLITKTMP